MTFHIVSTTQDQAFLGAQDTLIVTPTGALIGENWFSVVSTQGGPRITVAGMVWSVSYGIFSMIDDWFDEAALIRVAAGGLVFGETVGLFVEGGTILHNYGQIGGGHGVEIVGNLFNDARFEIHNAGRIDGDTAAIAVLQSFGIAYAAEVTNTGLIEGPQAIMDFWDETYWQIVNTGTIRGLITLGGREDLLINRGVIEGDIWMGGGADLIDNQRGTGSYTIFLGGGNDVARLGAAVERVFGESGSDTVTFAESNRRVVVNLANPLANRGDAAGDLYSGIESFEGTEIGGDVLTGDGQDNLFAGLGGADRLSGGAGNDRLVGGTGADTLAGGSGADAFVFFAREDAGDTVSDFSRAQGDKIELSIPAFGIGILNGTNFRQWADNLAQDGDDRLVFDTVTRTLWFDADGNGAEAPLLLLSLGNSANLGVVDFLLV